MEARAPVTNHQLRQRRREQVIADEAHASKVTSRRRTNNAARVRERRHHMLKGPQLVAPVYLEQPHRIEALLLCHFLAQLTEALLEREIRGSSKTSGRKSLPLYPESRDCPSPSAPRILEISSDAQRHHLVSDGMIVKDFDPTLTSLQRDVLELLHAPASVYVSETAS